MYSEKMGKNEYVNEREQNGMDKQVKGKIREEIGKITGNKKEQLKGKIEQVEGRASVKIEELKTELK